MFGKCGNAENTAKTAKERKKLAPKPLPPARPRALTAPLDDTSQEKTSWNPFKPEPVRQQTSDQSGSLLITKLPEELQQQIFKMVLGGHWLHVVRAPLRLLAIKCAEEPVTNTYTRYHACWGMHKALGLGETPAFYGGPRPDSTALPANLLPLLLTCRLVYSQAIDILYRDNVFDFNHIDTILYLSRTVMSSRQRRIRRVCLHWNFKYSLYPIFDRPKSGFRDEKGPRPPYNAETWHEVCRVLATFTDLQELTLYLRGTPAIDPLKPLLRPLHQIKATKTFDVMVPSLYRLEEDIDRHDLPFRLIAADEEEGSE